MKQKTISKTNPVIVFIISICIAQSAGIMGTFFTLSAIPTWYESLTKPLFNPPNYLFGPVWTILYTLMGIASGLLFLRMQKNTKDGKMAKAVLQLYTIQLLLNAVWTPVFFGAKNLFAGLVIIAILDVLIAFLITTSWKFDKRVSLLLVPYFSWVSFATLLNAMLWYLNP